MLNDVERVPGDQTQLDGGHECGESSFFLALHSPTASAQRAAELPDEGQFDIRRNCHSLK